MHVFTSTIVELHPLEILYPGMAVQVRNPNTPEAEAGGLGGHCYPGLNSKILSQNLSSAPKHLLLT